MSPKQKKKDSRPTILLVGSEATTTRVAQSLERLQVNLRWSPWEDMIATFVDDTTAAVLLVAPLGGTTLPSAVAHLANAPESAGVPLFAAVTDMTPVALIRRVYREGAAAVLEWPLEKHLFARLLVELLAVEFVRGPQAGPDRALARTIRAHLRTLRGFGRHPKIQVDAGVAVLSGQVDRLWQRLRLEEIVAAVPGVRSVVTRSIHVLPTDRADAQIRRDVVRLLRDTADQDESTLTVNVNQGFVRLAGSISDRPELNRCLRLIANVRGVRGVESIAEITLDKRYQDHQVARRLRKLVFYLLPGQSVRVAFFTGVAVLSGHVRTLPDKRMLESIVSEDGAVERVVNKLTVF